MVKKSTSGRIHLDDADIAAYICSNKESEFRKRMWKLVNKDYLNPKTSQQVVKSKKKHSPSNKPTKVCPNRKEMKTNTTASKINYDALKKLMEDDGEENSTGAQIGEDNHNNDGDDFIF
ncbi:hypothetical protein M5689_009430 [Euphorbia peplus]|nr:hypothetical protein M5689_009430 [Euphorbia peplus]